MDALAVRLTLPPDGRVEDFHLQENAPCRAHTKKGRAIRSACLMILILRNSNTYSFAQVRASMIVTRAPQHHPQWTRYARFLICSIIFVFKPHNIGTLLSASIKRGLVRGHQSLVGNIYHRAHQSGDQ
jgi:hypothetical protein